MEHLKQAIKWGKVHVFIGSTFNDMHAEWDYLIKKVFPRRTGGYIKTYLERNLRVFSQVESLIDFASSCNA